MHASYSFEILPLHILPLHQGFGCCRVLNTTTGVRLLSQKLLVIGNLGRADLAARILRGARKLTACGLLPTGWEQLRPIDYARASGILKDSFNMASRLKQVGAERQLSDPVAAGVLAVTDAQGPAHRPTRRVRRGWFGWILVPSWYTT